MSLNFPGSSSGPIGFTGLKGEIGPPGVMGWNGRDGEPGLPGPRGMSLSPLPDDPTSEQPTIVLHVCQDIQETRVRMERLVWQVNLDLMGILD